MVMKMIKYPNNIIPKHKYKTYANRGMTLESELNSTNTYYLENNIAVIYKKPTPVKVLKQINFNAKKHIKYISYSICLFYLKNIIPITFFVSH